MPDQIIPPEEDMHKIYRSPLGRGKGANPTNPVLDTAPAGDMPVSRVFSNLPADIAEDIRAEARREWEELHDSTPKV